MKHNKIINFSIPILHDTQLDLSIIEDRIMLLNDGERLKYYFISELGIKEDHVDFLMSQDGNTVKKLRELYHDVVKFDLLHGTKTSNYITEKSMQTISNLDSNQFANLDNVSHGVKYRASLTSVIKLAFEQSERILKNNGILIKDVSAFDIGCGAGKPLLVASSDMNMSFKKAIGIDYFKQMIDLANNNADIMGLSKQIGFKFADASEFRGFDDINLIYMYNPFDEHIMADLERNIRDNGGRTIVTYNKPLCAHLFSKENGWKLELEQISSDPDNSLKILSYGL